MVEQKNSYETIFVVNATLTDEAIETTVNKFKSLIEKNADFESAEDWGKRKLAYEIDDVTEGYYVLVNFSASPEFPKELERNYGIDENILRSIIVRKEVKE
ncbi:MAG: 30S ribosomal protein S6 [Clostridia bacterium]|nr:30S ribosomal protein S6 [Clostridia bacterium]MBQ7076491.1 30S ribosomal protein S6 [Clostridia bacterium]